MRFRVILSAVFVLKLFLATITPLGYDFVLYMSAVISNDEALSWSPWIVLTRILYSFWLSLPIDHGDTLRAIAAAPEQLLPSHYLLAALVKGPLLVCDMIVTYLLYKLGSDLGNKAIGRKAALMWVANPFATLFVEMWGSIDIILAALSLTGIALVLADRKRLSAIAVASGIALRMSPIFVWLALTASVFRRRAKRQDMILTALAGPAGILGYLYWISQGEIAKNALGFLMSSPLTSFYTPVTQTFLEYSIAEVYTRLGFAVMIITAYYLVAAEIWPRDDWAVVSLALSGVLLLYGLADWFPTAYLWVMPFIALSDSVKRRLGFSFIFYVLLAIFLLAFHNAELTSSSLSIFFIPLKLVPSGTSLVAAVQSANSLVELHLDLELRSALAGLSIAYAASTTWKSIRE